MFHLAWLRMQQFLGLKAKLHTVKRSGTFNPFGRYSKTGVKRGSRRTWLCWLLVSCILALMSWSASFRIGLWAFSGVVLFSLSWTWCLNRYLIWACPACKTCGQWALHAKTCSYDARFRRWEAMGLSQL
jgi:hypothetical protein